jgi:hypothetical protein
MTNEQRKSIEETGKRKVTVVISNRKINKSNYIGNNGNRIGRKMYYKQMRDINNRI